MDLRKILPYQRSLFILGDAGSERYTLFRSLSSNNAIFERIWHPEETLFKQCTWVLYTGDEKRILKETAKGFVHVDKADDVGTYYVAVKPGQIPHNVKLVFPPYHLDKESFTTYYKEHSCVTKSSAFVWLEGFPYGKSDTAQQLRYLSDLIGLNDLIGERERISVAITQIERKFLSTDIGSEEVGIQNAIDYFEHKGYRVLTERAQIPMQRSLLIDALTYHVRFSENIRKKYLDSVAEVQASLDLLEDDLYYAMEEINLLSAIDEAFHFKYAKHQQNIGSIWIKRLQDIYEKMIVTAIKKELYQRYHLHDLKGNVVAEQELTKLFNSVWSNFIKGIKKHRLSTTTNFTDELQYELEMKNVKSQWRTMFTTLVKTELPEACHNYLHVMIKPYLQNV